MADQVDDHVELTTKESRQAEGSKDTSWVLSVSLILAVAAGAVIFVIFF